MFDLVWKIYNEALGIEIGSLKTFEQFDLSSPEVHKIVDKRFTDGVPLNRTVISPGDMFESEFLFMVLSK